MKKIVVIGGANTDICGAPSGKLIQRDSNPGKVSVRLGGVGRNIAHNLCNLGAEVTFITAVGGDAFGDTILSRCEQLGMDVSLSIRIPEMASSTYMYLKDETGDMHIAISDMEVTGMITPAVIAARMDAINSADAVVIDANLREDTIRYIAEHCSAPLFADAVSTVKAVKLIPVLGKLAALKPNRYEAEKLTGEADPVLAARKLVEMGVRMAFVSIGEEGMIAATQNGVFTVHPEPVKTADATGAGDSATSAIVMGVVLGMKPEQILSAAAKAGAITASGVETNSPLLTAAAIGLAE